MLLSVFLDGKLVCEVEKALKEYLPVVRIESDTPKLVFVDSAGLEYCHDLSSVVADGCRWIHLSVRVTDAYAVLADCLVSREREITKGETERGGADGIRFSPFFLPESTSSFKKEDSRGQGLFFRGLHFSGRVTPGNVSFSCLCDACRKSFRLKSFHAGFSDKAYFYCGSGRHTLVIDADEPGAPAARSTPDPQRLAELEAKLPPCKECGEAFKHLNALRCPHCGEAYIDFEKHPGLRKDEYYGNYFYGEHCQTWSSRAKRENAGSAEEAGKTPLCGEISAAVRVISDYFESGVANAQRARVQLKTLLRVLQEAEKETKLKEYERTALAAEMIAAAKTVRPVAYDVFVALALCAIAEKMTDGRGDDLERLRRELIARIPDGETEPLVSVVAPGAVLGEDLCFYKSHLVFKSRMISYADIEKFEIGSSDGFAFDPVLLVRERHGSAKVRNNMGLFGKDESAFREGKCTEIQWISEVFLSSVCKAVKPDQMVLSEFVAHGAAHAYGHSDLHDGRTRSPGRVGLFVFCFFIFASLLYAGNALTNMQRAVLERAASAQGNQGVVQAEDPPPENAEIFGCRCDSGARQRYADAAAGMMKLSDQGELRKAKALSQADLLRSCTVVDWKKTEDLRDGYAFLEPTKLRAMIDAGNGYAIERFVVDASQEKGLSVAKANELVSLLEKTDASKWDKTLFMMFAEAVFNLGDDALTERVLGLGDSAQAYEVYARAAGSCYSRTGELEKILSYLNRGVEKGDPYSAQNLGDYYWTYGKTAADIELARQHSLFAYTHGVKLSGATLAKIYLFERDDGVDDALSVLEDLATSKMKRGLFFLSYMYAIGLRVDQDREKAKDYLRRGCAEDAVYDNADAHDYYSDFFGPDLCRDPDAVIDAKTEKDVSDEKKKYVFNKD